MNIPFLFGEKCHIHIVMVKSRKLMKYAHCDKLLEVGMLPENCSGLLGSVDSRRVESVN
jgi:hypothetical protein